MNGEVRAILVRSLRLEARKLNAKAKKKAQGKLWSEMDAEDLVDFKRWCDIQAEIARLKARNA